MRSKEILISKGNLNPNSLAGQVAIVTGAGRGIGFEAARALAWLGAYVIVAELDEDTGRVSAQKINGEMGKELATFIQTDVADEKSLESLVHQVIKNYGHVDIVLNNATVVPLGAVKDLTVDDWDLSYRVNLRGPVMVANKLLPKMLERDYGVFVCVSSSGAAPYMGPYEVMKMAQIELANTVAGEVEDTGVIAFTIGPGLVRTPGAMGAIKKLAPLYGKTVEEFFQMSENHIISPEAAGAGFAAAVALASRYHGCEIGSVQALNDAGIVLLADDRNEVPVIANEVKMDEILSVCKKVRSLLIEQVDGWKKRSLFERMWVFRDFTKYAGMSTDQWVDILTKVEYVCTHRDFKILYEVRAPFGKLVDYIKHLQELASGYVKDKVERQESLDYLRSWQQSAELLQNLMNEINHN